METRHPLSYLSLPPLLDKPFIIERSPIMILKVIHKENSIGFPLNIMVFEDMYPQKTHLFHLKKDHTNPKTKRPLQK